MGFKQRRSRVTTSPSTDGSTDRLPQTASVDWGIDGGRLTPFENSDATGIDSVVIHSIDWRRRRRRRWRGRRRRRRRR